MRALALTPLLIIAACAPSPTEEAHSERQATPFAVEWVAIPGGCFIMGDTRIYAEERPLTQACVSPFEMSAHEITNDQFAAFVDATGYKTRAERGWAAEEEDGPGRDIGPGSAVFSPPEGVARDLNWWRFVDGASWRRPFGPDQDVDPHPNAPVIHLTREDAQAYADWAGARLPREVEWEYAARGGLDGALMGWEEAAEPGLEARANTWNGLFPLINSAEDGYQGLAPVGHYPANGYGLYDMIGNAWEWTASPYFASHEPGALAALRPQGLDPSQPDIAVGVIKGGSFLCAQSYCYRFRPAARQAQDLAFGTSHIGFRLVRDPAPASES